MEKDSCIWVCLWSWLRTIWCSAPRLRPMTMRMPSRSDSSRNSSRAMSVMTPSLTSSAMRSMRLGFVDLVGDLGDDDGLAAAGDVFDGALGAHDEAAAAGAVGVGDAGLAEDEAAGGEVGAFDVLEAEVEVGAGLGFFFGDEGDAGVDDFGEVVRRDVGRHADGDAASCR